MRHQLFCKQWKMQCAVFSIFVLSVLEVAMGVMLRPLSDGQPGCLIRYEFGRYWPNNFNQHAYWECQVWGEAAVKYECPPNMSFQDFWQRCVPDADWQQTPYSEPPTKPGDTSHDQCEPLNCTANPSTTTTHTTTSDCDLTTTTPCLTTTTPCLTTTTPCLTTTTPCLTTTTPCLTTTTPCLTTTTPCQTEPSTTTTPCQTEPSTTTTTTPCPTEPSTTTTTTPCQTEPSTTTTPCQTEPSTTTTTPCPTESSTTTPCPTEPLTTPCPTEPSTTPCATEPSTTPCPTEPSTTPCPTEPSPTPTTPHHHPEQTTTTAPDDPSGICPGASSSQHAPGSHSCAPPPCTMDQWLQGKLYPTRDPTKFYQCGPGVGNLYVMPCAPGTCFSFDVQVCVHVYDWKNPCTSQ